MRSQPSYDITISGCRYILDLQIDFSHVKYLSPEIPFLNFLKELNEQFSIDLFLECEKNNLNETTKVENIKNLESFFCVLSFYLDIKINNNFEGFIKDDFSRRLGFTEDGYVEYMNNSGLLKSEDEFRNEYKNVFVDYIKTFKIENSEYKINLGITDWKFKNLFETYFDTNKIKEVENHIYLKIYQSCDFYLRNIYSKFNEKRFDYYQKYIENIQKEHFNKQFLLIKNLKIKEEYKIQIDKILKKNPDLNKPNVIGQQGKQLINYLMFHIQEKEILLYVNRVIHIVGNVYQIRETSNKVTFHRSLLRIIYNERIKKFSFGIVRRYLEINTPLVKDIHLKYKKGQIFENGLFLELKNIENQDSLPNGSINLVKNEDGITCLIESEQFNKYTIDDRLYFRKTEILSMINQKIEIIKSLKKDVIQKKYIEKHIVTLEDSSFTSEYSKDLKIIREKNRIIVKNFHNENITTYFFHQLCHRYENDVLSKEISHLFVIQNTPTQQKEEIERRSELIVNWFLRDFIQDDKWFYTFNVDNIDGSIVKVPENERKSNYKDYPFKTVFKNTFIWNNGTKESYKPYDFSIKFKNIDLKLEVKSTRDNEKDVLFISVKELEELLKNPDHYFFLRLSYIQKGKTYFGIQFNEEFYGRFYRMKSDTIDLVKNKLEKWKEYYKTNEIRFTVDQFELIPNTYNENSKPDLLPEPDVLNSKYWDKFNDFIHNEYFKDLERILDTYSEFPEVSEIREEFLKLKLDEKFKV